MSGRSDPSRSSGLNVEQIADGFATLVRGSWRTLLIMTIAGVAMGIAIVAITPRKYRAEATISTLEPDLSESGIGSAIARLGPIAELTGLGTAGGNSRAEAIALLKSRRLARDFLKTTTAIPWVLGLPQRTPGSPYSASDDELAKAVERFLTQVLSVREDRRTGLIVVSVTSTDRRRAANVVNALVAFCDAELRDLAIVEARKSEQLVSEEIAKASVLDLKVAMHQAYARALQKEVLARVRREYFFRVIDPAVPPLPDDAVSPIVPLVIGSGAGAGFSVGLLVAGLRSRRSRDASGQAELG